MDFKDLASKFACPICKSPVSYLESGDKSGYYCAKCDKVYPIRDGIPNFLINESVSLEDWQNVMEKK